MDLVPYEPMVNNAPERMLQGVSCGVHIVTEVEHLDEMLTQFDRWFAGRNEIVRVDEGTSDKRGLGFVILEWEGYMIDPLFIAILKDERRVIDFTTYTREEV